MKKKPRIIFQVSPEAKRKLAQDARKRKITVSHLLRLMVSNHLGILS